MLVVQTTDKGLRLVSKTTVVNTPIRLLESRTMGWRDIEVRAKDGATRSWRAKLVFDGSGYSSNPTALNVEKVSELSGEVIFD